MYTVKGVLILDNDGERILSKVRLSHLKSLSLKSFASNRPVYPPPPGE